MTRRIIFAILLSVWAVLVAAGVAAYVAVRAVLVDELDTRLVASAAALPDVSGLPGTAPDPQDRYLTRDPQGRIARQPATSPANARPKVINARFATLADGKTYRSVTVRFAALATAAGPGPGGKSDGEFGGESGGESGGRTVVYSTPADSLDRVLGRLAVTLGMVGVVGGVASAGVAAMASRAALRPLNDVADVVGGVDEHHLARRVSLDRLPVELRPVGGRLNDMLQRLETYFVQRRQFLADVSHELRTPVAALRTTLEVALARRQIDADRQRKALQDCLSDAKLLAHLIERLTRQVRGELRPSQDRWQVIDLSPLLDECLRVAEGLALAKHVTVAASVPENVSVRTQPDLLRRICLNLLANAVAYNKENGTVTLTGAVDGTALRLSVSDTGVGIAAEHLPHVFSPFYRADAARAPADGHLGLGLFQVQSDATQLNGNCRVDSVAGQGTTFTLVLYQCLAVAAADENATLDDDTSFSKTA